MSNKNIEKKDEIKEETKKEIKKTPRKTTKGETATSKKNSVNTSTKKKVTKKVEIAQVDSKIQKIINDENIRENSKKKIKETQEKKLKFGIFEYILLLIIISLIFSLLGYFIGLKGNKSLDNNYVTVNKELREFIEEYNYILENYYGEIDESELITNALKGMLSSIDDYSGFIDNGSNNNSISLQGEYEGLGIGILNTSEGDIVIATVYDDSPAAKAGIKVGDIVIKLNGEDLTGQDNSELVDKISELDGDINLTIIRDDEELEFNLKKEHVVLRSVTYEMLENNIGYIQVGIFAENTDEQFQEVLTNLESQNMQSLIIDLRGNSGGHLSSARNILSLFLNDTHIIYQTENYNGIEKVYSSGTKDKDYKIIILQDLGSASASEVVASSLREQLDAYIIGNTSFGKGTVQTVRNVDGVGKYKVTTTKWLTSNGVWIEGNGIVPDLEVSLTEDYFKNPTRENDDQFQAALSYLKEEN